MRQKASSPSASMISWSDRLKRAWRSTSVSRKSWPVALASNTPDGALADGRHADQHDVRGESIAAGGALPAGRGGHLLPGGVGAWGGLGRRSRPPVERILTGGGSLV